MADSPAIADELHGEVLLALEARKVRELRQARWYEMRHDGVRRKNLPWPNAADMHFPMADMQIDKLKPIYIKQVFASELLASFYSLESDYVDQQNSAERWFDHQVRHRSNFKKQVPFTQDAMLQDGKAFLKIFWDVDKKCLRYECIKDLYIIVPQSTREFQETDWLVHVETYSKAAYKRVKEFKQDDDFIKRISTYDETLFADAKYAREGIVKPTEGQIIVWRRYQRDAKGQWLIHSYSPSCPDEPVCPDKPLPYQHGKLIFVPFDLEWKDDGHYSSRGICERVAPFEAALNKVWNDKNDAMTLFNRPLMYSQGRLPNAGNLRWKPGQVLTSQVQRVDLGSPPISMDQEMENIRSIGEQIVQSPDFGIVKGPGQEARTATEIDKISQLSAQSQDGRGFIIGEQLTEVFEQSWALLKQYASEDLNYFWRQELVKLDPEALKGKYLLMPSGASDAWNKAARLQKASFLFDKLDQDPNANHEELVKGLLEATDPGLIKRIFRPTNTLAADQMEEQAEELAIMLIGYPAQIHLQDDDATHIAVLAQFVQRRFQLHEKLTPEQARLIVAHAQQHAAALEQKDPKVLKALTTQYGQVFQLLGRVAQAQPEAAPGQPPAQPAPQPAGGGL